jgi:hypothetical protein
MNRLESQDQLAFVQQKLRWMRQSRIWPNGPRYLWTDAFGVTLLVSLWYELHDELLLRECEWVVADVERVLGRPRGLRIGEEPDRDGQYYHYLAMWIFALTQLATIDPRYRERAIDLVRTIHPAFVLPGVGVIWKMREDLTGPYPGYGLGALDPFHGLVVYRLLAPVELAAEIAEMGALVEAGYPSLRIAQDLGLGMMLWMSHFFPDEPWAVIQRARALTMLDSMWLDPPGYFCREPGQREIKFAFTNFGLSIGLQAVGAATERVPRLHKFFETYRSFDHYDNDAITHVMECAARFPGRLIRRARVVSAG